MKIAVFHELPIGGARRVANDFSKELKKRHHVDGYIVDNEKNLKERECYTRVYFYRFISKNWNGNNWKAKLYKDTLELFNLYKLHRIIAGDIDKKKYDVVIVHPSKFTQAPFVLRFLMSNKVYYAHEAYRIMYEKYFGIRHSGNPSKDLYEFLSRRIKKTIDAANLASSPTIFVNSENTKRNIFRFYSRRSTVCYPGIDTAFFKMQKVKKTIDVLFIGSTADNTDGFFDLKNAIDILKKKIKLEVVGGGEKWIDDKKLRLLYAQSKMVFCGAHNEPFGLIPLEAILCGSYVVAINEGGYKETYIKGRTILVERKTEAIANAILKILRRTTADSPKRKEILKWGLRYRTRIFEKEIENALKKQEKSS